MPSIGRKELATSGVPNSEVLGCLNEGSEKALDVQLYEAILHGYRREDPERAAEVSHGVTQAFIGVLLRWVRSLDYDLRQKLCEHILSNGEKAGKSSSKGNLAESSDAPNAKRTRSADLNLVGSKNSAGLRPRGESVGVQIRLPGTRETIWLGTYKTAEAAAQARGAAANWLATHSCTKPFNVEARNELKKCAKKAGEHLSDDRSHHNVDSPDLVENLEEKATTLASLKGKAVASAEHVSQWESPAQENPFSSGKFEEKATTLASLKRKAVASAEHVSQWESPVQENPLSPSEFEEKETTLASLKGKAVASAEHVSQRESLAQENPFSSSEFEEKATTLASLKRKAVASAEHVSQWESPAQENPLSPSEFEVKATTLASLKGKAVASAEHVSQWESPTPENPFSSSEFDDWLLNVLISEEVGLQQETNVHWCHALNRSQ
jgi:hypothetical protein